ncbi:hypothetical protein BKA61DRAFT_678976 [Leptodontidium sp. MPI-SDFR-AT-0119]|nr:hypothetical protein BKA61DRAFT_678976 [Leptodontidium sp. MPI-SDFR-AT-0119]
MPPSILHTIRRLVSFGAPHLDFKKRTKGIQPKHPNQALVNIFMLRRTASTLPVEIFLETEDDYEPHMCDGVFADWGAKCILLSSLLRSSNFEFKIARPQMWIFLLRSPDGLFDSELFTSVGLVLWPSLEDSSFSSQTSEVIGLDEDIISEIPDIDHRQILISKKRHANTLSLAAYYSIHEACNHEQAPPQSQATPSPARFQTIYISSPAIRSNVKPELYLTLYTTSNVRPYQLAVLRIRNFDGIEVNRKTLGY